MGIVWEWADHAMEFIFTNGWYSALGCIFLTQTLVHSLAMIILRITMALEDHFISENVAMIICFVILAVIAVVFYKYIFWVALFEVFYVAYFLPWISWVTLGENAFKLKK